MDIAIHSDSQARVRAVSFMVLNSGTVYKRRKCLDELAERLTLALHIDILTFPVFVKWMNFPVQELGNGKVDGHLRTQVKRSIKSCQGWMSNVPEVCSSCKDASTTSSLGSVRCAYYFNVLCELSCVTMGSLNRFIYTSGWLR